MTRPIALVALCAGALAPFGCTYHYGPAAGPDPVVVGDAPAPDQACHTWTYNYYPDDAVYYCTTRRMWFWIEGDNWTCGARLPDRVWARLGTCVSVELDCDRPQDRHAEVCAQHPGNSHPRGKAKGHWKH